MPDTASHNLLQLYRRIQQGDQKAFDRLFHSLYASLCLYCYGYTQDKPAAEDIASEAFINLWQKRASLLEPQYMKTFLYRTARNICLNWLQQEKRIASKVTGYHYSSDKVQAPVTHAIINAEVARQLHLALESLPNQCGRIFRMLYIEGKSPKQVAEELKLSISTVYNQQAYGLSLLRKRLGNLFSYLVLFGSPAFENYFSNI